MSPERTQVWTQHKILTINILVLLYIIDLRVQKASKKATHNRKTVVEEANSWSRYVRGSRTEEEEEGLRIVVGGSVPA